MPEGNHVNRKRATCKSGFFFFTLVSKFPVMRKLKTSYRVKSLARELEQLKEPFQYFTPNTIQISNEGKEIFISGHHYNYIVMIGQDWRFETFEKSGRSLLYRLVAMNVLPERFLPVLPKYIVSALLFFFL